MAQFMIWKEDENQDRVIENGSFVLLEDEAAVIQQLGTILRLAKNDWFMNLNEGLRWVDNNGRGILGENSLSLENEAEIIEKSNNSFGVRQLISLTTDFIGSTFLISATVSTIFSQTPITVTINIA